jgi:hypothetical protein
MKLAGPGQRLGTELLAQSLVQRQLPSLLLPHLGLVQHLTSAGSLGQAPLMVVPPLDEHPDVEMQTPVMVASQPVSYL